MGRQVAFGIVVMPNFPDPTLIAFPAFFFLVALEWWAVKTRRAKGKYTTSDAILSMTMGIGSVIAGLLAGLFGISGTMFLWEHRFFDMPTNLWSLVLAFIVYDLVYYWKHRFMHRLRWLWAVHVVHHSSNHYNLTTVLRQPWTGAISGIFILLAPMILIGWHPAVIGFVAGIKLIYQFWIHTEVIDRMPRWFEAVMNTPSHHRVHHSRNARYLDSNYAGVFIIWDKMFGTFVAERDDDKPDYGLVKQLHSNNPLWVVTHEYWALLKDFAADGLRPDRWLRRLFMPPGWSPLGDHNGSAQFKAAFIAAHPDQAGQPGLPKKALTTHTVHAE